MPARPSEPRLGARPEAGASRARTHTHAGWGAGRVPAKPRPRGARIGSAQRSASPSHRPSLFPGLEPPARRVGTALACSLAGSLARALRRPPVCPARARRRSDDAAAGAARGGAAAALGGPESSRSRSRSAPRATEGGRSRRGCSSRSGGGKESGPRRGRGGGEESGPGVRGRGGCGGPPAQGIGEGGWDAAAATSEAERQRVLPPRARATSPTASGQATAGVGPAGEPVAGRGQPACTGWTRRRPAPQGCVGGAPPEPGCRTPRPRSGRIWISLATTARVVRAPRPDHACRPLHLGSVHLEKDLFLEIATGSVRYRGGVEGGTTKLQTPRRPGLWNKVELEEQPPR